MSSALTDREAELLTARLALPPAGEGHERPLIGPTMSGFLKHGGVYLLLDTEMMAERMSSMVGQQPAARQAHASMLTAAKAIPTYFFYHLVKNKAYALHARLISYLTYPTRHLSSSLQPSPAPAKPAGITYSQDNIESHDIPAAFTFVGQFIDHDLTLNPLNLFDEQSAENTKSQASPLIDLDSVYGIRVDENHPDRPRKIPTKDGYFRLRAIEGGGFDVCRHDNGMFGGEHTALIGDKRNDENQIILQIHILIMRMHNAFRAKMHENEAKEQTILHWQSFVANEYLTHVADPAVVKQVRDWLSTNDPQLKHRAHKDAHGKWVLRMPHEFAIGFRFGHSQLRSDYRLNAGHTYRLFDSLSDGKNDLQGGKPLDAPRVIDWPFFLAEQGGMPTLPSNAIDTKVNEVVFDLPESTIPDMIKPVSNLPFRNLVRSDKVGLCAGEDLAELYGIKALQADEVDKENPEVFKLVGKKFRTPLWYYLLREAEVDRMKAGSDGKGHLGRLGSRLVSEVILSGIYYAETSYLHRSDFKAKFPTTSGDPNKVRLIDIANFVNSTPVTQHPCEG